MIHPWLALRSQRGRKTTSQVLFQMSVLLSVDTVQGGRYSDPDELQGLVIPLIVVAVFLLSMLVMVAVFTMRNRQCLCLCCRRLWHKEHSLVQNDITHCHCDMPRQCVMPGDCRNCESSTTVKLDSNDTLNEGDQQDNVKSCCSQDVTSSNVSVLTSKECGLQRVECGSGSIYSTETKCAICCRCEKDDTINKSRQNKTLTFESAQEETEDPLCISNSSFLPGSK